MAFLGDSLQDILSHCGLVVERGSHFFFILTNRVNSWQSGFHRLFSAFLILTFLRLFLLWSDCERDQNQLRLSRFTRFLLGWPIEREREREREREK